MSFPKSQVSRRRALFSAAVCVTVLGMVIHFFFSGELAGLVADALYTVLVYLVLALVIPRARPHALALVAFALSAFIELAQLTGIPGQLAVSFPPSHLLFGTTFSALDLVAYAGGAVAIFCADRAFFGASGVRHTRNSSAALQVPPM